MTDSLLAEKAKKGLHWRIKPLVQSFFLDLILFCQ